MPTEKKLELDRMVARPLIRHPMQIHSFCFLNLFKSHSEFEKQNENDHLVWLRAL